MKNSKLKWASIETRWWRWRAKQFFFEVGADGKLTDHVGHDVAARLGFDMDESRDRFELALREMSKVHFCVTVKRKMTFQAGIKVTSGLFRHGDLMDIFDPSGKLSAFSSTAEIGIPSVPIVQVYTGIDMGSSCLFTSKPNAGEYQFKVQVVN